MQIRYVHSNDVAITYGFDTLYGLKLEGTGELIKSVSGEEFRALLRRSRNSGRRDNVFSLVIKKTKLKCWPSDFENAYRTEIFLFTFSPILWKELEVLTGFKPMTGEELANSLFRVHTLTDEYYFEDRGVTFKNLPHFSEDTVFFPPVGKSYQTYWRNEVEKAKQVGEYPFIVMKALSYVPMNPDFTPLVKVPWEGVFWFRFNLNNVYGVLKNRASILSSERERKFWKEFSEKYKEGEADAGIMEITFISRKDVIPVEIFTSLGINPIEWSLDAEKIVKETPLLLAEENFEIISYPEDMAKFIPVSFVKTKSVKAVDTIYGINQFGEFVSYSFFDEGQSPHACIIAPARSGKSFLLQKLAVELMDVDPEALWSGEGLPEERDLPVYIRWFDVGFSAEFLVRLLKERGYPVEIVSPYPDVKVNPFEIDSYEDIDTAVTIVNLILTTKGEEALKGLEDAALRQTLMAYLDYKKELSFWLTEPIRILKDFYPETYRELLSKGYDDDTRIGEIADEYKVFSYPRTVDVIRIAKDLKLGLPDSATEELKAFDSLIRKLKVIAGIQNFKYWSDFSSSKAKLTYFDLSFIKGTSYFVPLYYAIYTKVVKEMRKLPVHTRKFFFSDEFHNITRIPLFAQAFEVLVREAAKYNTYLFMVTQEPIDIPEVVANNIGTKIFLKKAVEGEKESTGADMKFESSMKDYLKLSDEVVKVYSRLPKYTSLFVYSGGFFTFRVPLKRVELTLYESRTITEIETPDGIRIKKSYVEEE